MTQDPETIDVRRTEVLRVSGVVQSIYERRATTKKGRLLAGQLAKAIAHLWAEDPNAGRAPAQFREITDDRLKQELVRLSRLGEEGNVADEVKTIHQSTIVVLADFGFVGAHHAGSDDRVRLVAATEKALEARAYIKTKEKPITRKVVKGAPVNNRAAAARRMLAEHYKFLTGRRPTMTGRISAYCTPAGGQFFEFTKSVLAALNIKASTEAQTRQIAYPQRRKAK
jgi:hypothetical protein